MWRSYLSESIERLHHENRHRERGGGSIKYDLDFGSNDYLGLRNHPLIQQAIKAAIDLHGWGSGASPVLSGYHAPHRQLECALAELCDTEDCVVFSSGYACNVGVLASLLDTQSIVFSDQLNHASLIDGIRLSRASREIYKHCDLDDLKRSLETNRWHFERGLIVTESVFSMDGDHAPLVQIVELAEQFNCGLVVDEAHATGVYGPRGGGLVEELGLVNHVTVKLGTLSKALGGIGGYAAGSHALVDLLVNRSRSYIFSTAPPAAAMVGGLEATRLMRGMSRERSQLLELAAYARNQLTALGWNVTPGTSPIIPVVVGPECEALALTQKLRAGGIYVPAIRPPTVPPLTSRLRISLSAQHTMGDVDRLCQALEAS